MKYRTKHKKIKSKHHNIENLEEFLEKEIEPLEYIQSILPGRIEKTKGMKKKLFVRFQYATESGAKLIAHSGGAVQEIFIVTNRQEDLRKKIEALFHT